MMSHCCAYLGVLTRVLSEPGPLLRSVERAEMGGVTVWDARDWGRREDKTQCLEPEIEEIFKCWLHEYYMTLVRLWLNIAECSNSWIFLKNSKPTQVEDILTDRILFKKCVIFPGWASEWIVTQTPVGSKFSWDNEPVRLGRISLVVDHSLTKDWQCLVTLETCSVEGTVISIERLFN